jgi:hypothetical protein
MLNFQILDKAGRQSPLQRKAKMYTVMIRIGNARKSKRAVFEDPVKAEEYFNELCQRRTEYPASVILAYRILVKKKYRIDKDFKGERLILDEDLTP